DGATDDDWPEEELPRADRSGDGPGADRPGGGPAAGWHGPPPPWPGAPGWRGDWPPPRSRRRGVALAAVAAAALVAGAGVTLAVTGNLPFSSSPAAAQSSSPGLGGPGQSGNGQVPGGSTGGGALPGGGAPPSGASVEMFLAGPVQAVSRTSITIGGAGRSVTAAITSSTHITGRVSDAAAIKVGDLVSAQLTMRDGRPIATTIRDPAG